MRLLRPITVLTLFTLAAATVPALPATPVRAAPGPSLPTITPTPQKVSRGHGTLAVPDEVTVVRAEHTDPAALSTLTTVLHDNGVRDVRTVDADAPPPTGRLTVYLGGPTENPATAGALSRLGTDGPDGLAAEGYVLAAGTDHGRGLVALSGVDTDGTYYAVQTLRQILTRHGLPALTVRDWPAMPVRGTIEGFYGTPWSHAARLDQFDFYGAHKLNTYEYSPKDDPYLRAQWRAEYPADKLAELTELVDRAAADHVRFTYALSPGLSVCYSSDDDLQALVDKFEQVYAIGVRSFNVPLDDISYTKWNCDADAAKFGSGAAAAGAAQAYLLNRLNTSFVSRHEDVERLQTVATEYYDVDESPYKKALREQLDDDVIVMWTGIGVIAHDVTVAQATAAREVFGHDILLWDNYPVNDYLRGRLEMAPYLHREVGLSGALVGDTSNPMNQADASKIALYTVADFVWNDKAYDPQRSWGEAITEYAGGDADLATALRAFCDAEYQIPNITGEQAPELTAAVTDFWTAWQRGDERGVAAFARRVTDFAAAPDVIRRGTSAAFRSETGPWLESMGAWGQAMSAALDMLRAQRAGDGDRAAADRARIPALVSAAKTPVDPIDGKTTVKVADGVADTFVTDALAANTRWLGAGVDRGSWTVTGAPEPAEGSSLAAVTDRDPDTGYAASRAAHDGEALTLTAPTARALDRVLVVAGAHSDADVQIRSGDGDWRTLGRLTGRYTDLSAHGRSADRIRLRWRGGTPTVAEVVPIAADAPAADVAAQPGTVAVETSDRATFTLTVSAAGTEAVHGDLRVHAPDGLTAEPASQRVSLRRGDRVRIPVTLSADAGAATGERSITVSLGDVTVAVPVRVYPHTTDDDVALASGGATATASSVEIGDETRFGAGFAIDGDDSTRWSSGYDDGAWLTVALPASHELGKVVLSWEASYGKAYRVQVSTDGEQWATVADVTDGNGGTDTLRFDGVDARYVRMQGVKRALQYGYSLWTLAAYPVG
ncbi:MAG: beta-N-acetylglucosaminidase domain-containing protein [Actinocatenispora sp.]